MTQYVPLGTVATPADWTLPSGLEITLEAVFAHFDGTSAGGSFLPTLEIVSDSGHTVAQIPMDASVAAGSSVEATWAPFLRGAAGGGSTPSSFVGAMVTKSTTQTFNPSGTITWDSAVYDTSTGATMWSAGSPTLLTAPAAGIYIACCDVQWQSSSLNYYDVIIHMTHTNYNYELKAPSNGGGFSALVAVADKLNAGASVYVTAQAVTFGDTIKINGAGGPSNFSLTQVA